ncbi:MAG: leucine-rich repeat protein [Eubacterium sp.]|nr:leucine-rich repeat protein [Eubacterium sp.]MBR1531148.1 leucine-rich repeat protein [Eubacterium sp.]
MKKSLSIVLSLIMIIASIFALPFTAHALDASGTCGVNVNYTFDEETGALVISGTGAITDYTESNKSPFHMATAVKSIEIKDGVKGIGANAFKLCANAKSIKIPASVESIGAGAFMQCYYLESIIVPDGINDIENNTFNSCVRLERIVLPLSTSYIGEGAFCNCKNLKAVLYKGNEAKWSGITVEAKSNDDLNNAAKVYNFTFKGTCVNDITNDKTNYSFDMDTATLTISGNGEMADYEEPGNSPFYRNAAIKTVIIKKGIETTGEYAFAECTGLEDVIIEEGTLTTIGWETFCGCTGLKTINIPYSVKYYSEETFDGASDTFTITADCSKNSVFTDYVEGTHRVWNKTHKYCRSKITSTTATSYKRTYYCFCGENSYTKTFNKEANTFTAKGKTKTLKYKTLKKKNLTLKRADAITVSNAKGTVTYTKASGNKKIVVNKKTGKFTVKKGIKKGTYKVKVKVKAAGTQKIKAKTVTVTVKIKVK